MKAFRPFCLSVAARSVVVLLLSTLPAIASAQTVLALPAPGTSFRDCDMCPEMVVVPAGTFLVGSPASEPQRDNDEGPQQRVTISKSFAAGKYEVTRAQYARFVEESGHPTNGGCYSLDLSKYRWSNNPSADWRNPGFSQTDNDPVTCVNWRDAKAYAEWLSRKTGKSYRLLTEAEWEYVARAGTTTAFNTGAALHPTQANYNAKMSYAGSPTATSVGKTVPVGSYAPNAFGLHDVHGNVDEWVEDCRNESHAGAPTDGRARLSGDCAQRVARGGSWIADPVSHRSADRSYWDTTFRVYFMGIRVARAD